MAKVAYVGADGEGMDFDKADDEGRFAVERGMWCGGVIHWSGTVKAAYGGEVRKEGTW